MCWKCYRNIAIEVVEAEGRYLVLYLGPDCYVVGCIKYFKYLPTYVVWLQYISRISRKHRVAGA